MGPPEHDMLLIAYILLTGAYIAYWCIFEHSPAMETTPEVLSGFEGLLAYILLHSVDSKVSVPCALWSLVLGTHLRPTVGNTGCE